MRGDLVREESDGEVFLPTEADVMSIVSSTPTNEVSVATKLIDEPDKLSQTQTFFTYFCYFLQSLVAFGCLSICDGWINRHLVHVKNGYTLIFHIL